MRCPAKPNIWFIVFPVILVVVSCQTVNLKKRFNYLNKVAVDMQHDMASLSKQIHVQREIVLNEDSPDTKPESYTAEIISQQVIDEENSTTWQAVNQIFYEHSGFSLNRIQPIQNASLAGAQEATEAIFVFLFILAVALMIAFIYTIISGAYFEGLGCAGCVLFFFIFLFLAALIEYAAERM